MFERFERELLPKEKRLLSQKISYLRGRRRNGWKDALVICLALSAMSSCAVLFDKGRGGKIPLPGNLKVWFILGLAGLFLLVFVWAWASTRRDLAKRIARLAETLARNRAAVTRIASEQMVEFEEIEDEGACYAFQVADDKIAFVVGQEFYPSAKFPNSDFDIVDICAADGTALEGGIEKRGKKLAPIRKIQAEVKKTLDIPEHLSVINGKLEQLEVLLRAQK